MFQFYILYVSIYTLNNIYRIVAFTGHVNLAFLCITLIYVCKSLYIKQYIEDLGIYWITWLFYVTLLYLIGDHLNI